MKIRNKVEDRDVGGISLTQEKLETCGRSTLSTQSDEIHNTYFMQLIIIHIHSYVDKIKEKLTAAEYHRFTSN